MNKSQKLTLAVCISSMGASIDELNNLPLLLERLSSYFRVLPIKDVSANDMFDSQSVGKRIQSVSQALSMADVTIAFNGGYNSIELFSQYSMIRARKESVFIGYSDNTLLVNALPATNKCRGWLGPMIATMLRYPEYVDLCALNIMNWLEGNYRAVTDQYNSLGMKVLNVGTMRGPIIGGNAYTFDLLQGTKFSPKFNKPFIYLLEGENFIMDSKRVWQDTVRNFDSIMLQTGARKNIQGLLISKYPSTFKLNESELIESIKNRKYLKQLPVIYDFPRGYDQPSLIMPVGEEVSITAFDNNTISINGL